MRIKWENKSKISIFEAAFSDFNFDEYEFFKSFIFIKAAEWHYVRGLIESDIDLAPNFFRT